MIEHRSEARDAPRVESTEVDPRFTAAFLYGSIGIVAVAIGVTSWLYAAWRGPDSLQEAAKRGPMTPQISVNAAPLSVKQRQERIEYDQRQAVLLSSYGWIDREKGIARIPLAVAMQRIASDKESSE